jgi:purine-binding chemotaxis protein CheW
VTARVNELHDAFDRGFASPPPPPEPAHSDFLCIEIAGEPSAIRLAEIVSLHADLRIVALPTRAPELLGVAAIRAAIVPIYDLGIALGAAGKAAARWTVLLRGGTVGFAFAGYDGHARIADRAIASPAGSAAGAPRGYVRGQFNLDGQPRSVIDLAAVRMAIELRWHPRSAAKDH